MWDHGFASVETRHLRKDGEIRDIVLRAAPVLADDPTTGVIVAIEDVTDRKRTEEEKKKLEAQLHQALKMEAIGTLAGGIAHDFNNILSAVIGYTEIALDDIEKDTQLYDNLQEVLIAGNRAKDLVNQILTFARQSDAEVKPTKVSTIAKDTLKLIRSTIPSSIEIKQNIDSDSLVMANPTLIHQIFMNLYTNANHAMEDEGGVLEVNLVDVTLDSALTKFHKGMKPGDYLKLTVSDTGTGISPNIIGLIFEPYFTTKEPGEGTGMGLAMVHGIVKGYDGEITVESKMGKGTVFTVYLPITKISVDKKPYPVEETPLGTEQILFVDDELPIVKMNKQALESLGYKVTTRTSSIEALELFRSKPNDFNLVITDMTMPNMNGDELAGELMKIRPDIPVIISTGYSKKISNERAAEIGIKAFAMKPISKTELAKIVRRVLDEPKV
jgi:signal transduction histidine kinase/CheY-like chemotaxis protein